MKPAPAMAAAHELQPGNARLLLRHTWPGNVRELQNAAERFALGLELALDNSQVKAAAAPWRWSAAA
jgi:two-component system C4-dicarboxylate transport response regulator DctD